MAEISEAQFPGLTQKIINFLEWIFCVRFITKIQDLIIRTQWLDHILSTLVTMWKISANFADMFKDTFLTVSLLIVVGGPKAVLLYPTQFTSVVVLGQAASIIVPFFMSGLHLALYNPYILFNGLNSRRIVAMIICIMCSPQICS